MPDITHDFPVAAPPERVFAAFSSPTLLDAWWTLRSSGRPELGATYELFFGEPYDWRAEVTACEPGHEFAITFTRADSDWTGTRLHVGLAPTDQGTQVRFSHRGWAAENDHYRTSCFCWAMYLRLMKRYLEAGETIPYDRRLDA